MLGLDFDDDTGSQTASGDPTIVGSKLFAAPPGTEDSRSYLIAIDGKLVGSGRVGWDEPVAAAPGWHAIEFGVTQGTSASGAGRTEAKLDPGKAYVLTIAAAEGASITGWLADPDGHAVSNKIPVGLQPDSDATIKGPQPH